MAYQNDFCVDCGGIHKGNCSSPHSPFCFCPKCYGVQVHKDQKPKDKKQMITLQRNNAPETSSTPKGVQFLSPRHILDRKNGMKMTVTKVTTDKPDNFSNPVVVYFRDENGQRYSKGYKLSSDGLASLVALFDADDSKWAKKALVVNVKTDEDGGERLTYSAK